MSITLERLRALKRQAGDASGFARAAADTRQPEQLQGQPQVPPQDTGATTMPSPLASVRARAQPLLSHPGALPPGVTTGRVQDAQPPPAGPHPPGPDGTTAPVPGGASGIHQPMPRVMGTSDGAAFAHGLASAAGTATGAAGAAGALHAGGTQTGAMQARGTAAASLRRLLGIRERAPAPLPPRPRGPLDRTVPGEEIAPGLQLIQTRVPLPHDRAAYPLAFARREDHVDPRALMFFDTETTGLAGGTGTRAFMIGAADWPGDDHPGGALRIRQLLITTLAAETAMLRTFAQWLGADTVLCSYNGRSYDAPLLKTRYRLARLGDPITPLDHVDLLHPTRRRYRGRWENCRLATVERELLSVVREDDLPGSQAPAAWLGYLRGGAATNLRRVAAHNHQDVVTLARLLARLVQAQADDAAALT